MSLSSDWERVTIILSVTWSWVIPSIFLNPADASLSNSNFFLFEAERNILSRKVDTIPADRSFPTPQLGNKKPKFLLYLQVTDSWLDVRDPTHKHRTHTLIPACFPPRTLPSFHLSIHHYCGPTTSCHHLLSLVQLGKVCARYIFPLPNAAEQSTSGPSDSNQELFISHVSALWAGLSWAGLPLHLALAGVRCGVTAEVRAGLGWKIQEAVTNWGLHTASLGLAARWAS